LKFLAKFVDNYNDVEKVKKFERLAVLKLFRKKNTGGWKTHP